MNWRFWKRKRKNVIPTGSDSYFTDCWDLSKDFERQLREGVKSND